MQVENDLFSEWGSVDLVLLWVVEIDLVFVYVPKMTRFRVGIEIDLVFVWVIEIYLMSVWKIKTDLISVKGSELTWFLCWGRKWLGFSAWIEIVFVSGNLNWFDFRVGIEIDLNSVSRSNLTWFCVGDRHWLDFSMVIENDLAFVLGIEIDFVLCVGQKWLVFSIGIDWLGFCVG